MAQQTGRLQIRVEGPRDPVPSGCREGLCPGTAPDTLVYLLGEARRQAGEVVRYLCLYGYRVEVFDTPGALMEACRTQIPAALIVDLALEGVDGFGGPRFREGLPAAVPVVFLSQRGDFASRVAAVRAGGAAFLTLPLQLDALYLWMEALTRRRPQVPYRVLLVDDEAANVQLHARFLREASMVTHCVTDPREVSEAVQEFHPDVVLMEWAMPHCSGLELAAVLRQQDALLALPIVFLASEDRLDQRMEALAQGGDDFLVKPVQAELLVSSVATRARRYRAIGAQLCRDGLTGLLNHRKLKEDLTLELARARRNQSPLAFAMLDLDHFKDVNDHCGHPAGDEVLKTLARLIVQRVRRTDSVGRYGGEEFGIIFPDSTSEQAFALLDEIRIQFGSTLHRSGDVVFQVTLSGGIASYPECKEGRELILAADKALYRAKRGGRDRLAVAAGP